MHTTAIKPALPQRLTRWAAGRIGWSHEVFHPIPDKCVIVGAHHTSGTDLLAALYLSAATRVKFRWVGKHTLFKGPMGWILKTLGGFPVKRGGRTGFVERVVSIFEKEKVFRLALMPDGTRHKADHWKTSFYHIALQARVPIVMGFIDYGRKVVGFGPQLQPTGDLGEDIQIFRSFYSGVTGRFPERHSEIRLQSER